MRNVQCRFQNFIVFYTQFFCVRFMGLVLGESVKLSNRSLKRLCEM